MNSTKKYFLVAASVTFIFLGLYAMAESTTSASTSTGSAPIVWFDGPDKPHQEPDAADVVAKTTDCCQGDNTANDRRAAPKSDSLSHASPAQKNPATTQ